VAQRLGERPLAVHRLVQQPGRQAPGVLDGLGPETVKDVPRLAESGRVGWAHLGPVGAPPVELRLNERPEVDAVDRHVLDRAVDLDVAKLDAPHHDAAQVHLTEPGAGQVTGEELRAAQIGPLEPRASQVRIGEVSHDPTVTPDPDDPRPGLLPRETRLTASPWPRPPAQPEPRRY
jgi:hypothetical protein